MLEFKHMAKRLQAQKLRTRRVTRKHAKKTTTAPAARAEIPDDGTPGVPITSAKQAASWPELRYRVRMHDGRTGIREVADPRASFAKCYLEEEIGDAVELLPITTGPTVEFIPPTPLYQVFLVAKDGTLQANDDIRSADHAATMLSTYGRFGGTGFARRVESVKLSAECATIAELLAAKAESDALIASCFKPRTKDRREAEADAVKSSAVLAANVIAPDNVDPSKRTVPATRSAFAPEHDADSGPTLDSFAQVVCRRTGGKDFVIAACVARDSAERIAAEFNRTADDDTRATVHELTLPNFAAKPEATDGAFNFAAELSAQIQADLDYFGGDANVPAKRQVVSFVANIVRELFISHDEFGGKAADLPAYAGTRTCDECGAAQRGEA